MTLAPLLEAADSMAKASTPEPFSRSKTSNWVARGGGLPAYIQHIAHDIMEKRGKSESNAIQIAIGVVKRWAKGVGNVDAGTRAAAAKAVAEWEALKARSGAKSVVQHSAVEPGLADLLALRDASLERVALIEGRIGTDGMVALLDGAGALQEAAGAFAPTMARCASATEEAERHNVVEAGQKVGMVSKRKVTLGSRMGAWHAFAVNGERLGGYDGHPSREAAVDALRSHLEEAPARVLSFPQTGEYLVAKPSSYSGQVSYQAFPSEGAARHAAGLPAAPTGPEKNSRVAQLTEALTFSLSVLSGENIPPLRRVQEARRRLPFDFGESLVESFSAGELRDFHGRWRAGGGHHAGLSALSVRPRGASAKPPQAATAAHQRYEGGVVRASARARAEHAAKPQIPLEKLPESVGVGAWSRSGNATSRRLIAQKQLGQDELVAAVKAGRAVDTEKAHRTGRNGEYSPERQALHERIVANLLQGKGVHEGKARAIFTAGGPASGKSSLEKHGLVSLPGDVVHANPDVVREMLPEYQALKAAGRSDASSLTHEEASMLAKRVTRIALGRQHHILVDTVGDSGPGKFAEKIDQARRAGHHVSVHYTTISTDEALARAKKRAARTGRHVPTTYLRGAHADVSARFHDVLGLKGVHVQVFDNHGSKPRLIAERRHATDKLLIADKRAYEAFLAKAKAR